MSPDHLAGLVLLVLGATVTGTDLLAPVSGPWLRFDAGEKLALNAGDVFDVVPTPDGTARRYEPSAVGDAIRCAATGIVLAATGAVVLVRGLSEGAVDPRHHTRGPAIGVVVTALCCLVPIAVGAVIRFVRDLVGSTATRGIAVEVVAIPFGQSPRYRPLVRYRHGEHERLVWATRRMARIELGDPVSVQVTARPPYTAVPDTAGAVVLRLVLVAGGLTGLISLGWVWTHLG
ncbi:hypothetical protein [Amycolatopsis sp. CA-230715]|uniref:hypothetical protein n=1 Tax=Amycolatopsis sp. CA-230715 TaxID=2745196 RepID=UPI001C00D3D7|nr:hypothetical protein [Amycolatopsis sp. CA-230715]QWF85538.1 hypothetical protein HUW46_08993 [Amycolatopsis sp. CA-230715]